MSIDPRLMERRKTVAEYNAKRSMSRLLRFLLLVVVLGSLVWLAFSPWLSIQQVSTTGIVASSGNSVLVDEGVVAGTPMVLVDVSGVEERLLEDPWVAEAAVRRLWPNEVSVEVVERTPAAWVQTEGGWTRRAVDGVALPSPGEPDMEMAWIDMPDIGDEQAMESTDILGSLRFVAALPEDLHPGTMLTRVGGEVWATVSGHQVRLGRAVDMAEKALSLAALLEEDIAEGSTLVLIAPTNPAVMTPNQTGVHDEADAGTGDEEEEDDGSG